MQTRNSFQNMKWTWAAMECVCVCVCDCTVFNYYFNKIPASRITYHVFKNQSLQRSNDCKHCKEYTSLFPETVLLFSSAPRPGCFCGSSSGAADIPCGTKKNCGQHLENSEERRKQLCSNGLNFHLTVKFPCLHVGHDVSTSHQPTHLRLSVIQRLED